ncbi:hypothetical protein PsYK624_057370 [Phanerochaete sordida]|uniref:RanBD1 domain-containing protein n=1 Tax=Phanerochaete sordida TaxID=48140 RepID=A0A9P3G7B4_9APHY|nr:hypothetical protein PsYK624_057370 [Phanerochaete sordida]
MSDRMKSEHDDDLPTYVELFGHQGGARPRTTDNAPSTSRTTEEITLYEVLGKFFTFTKGADGWTELGSCRLQLAQNKSSRAIHVVVTYRRTKMRHVEHPLSAIKNMRAHNACSRSRVWDVRADGDGKDRARAQHVVYCFRCPSPKLAQELEAAYKNARALCTAHLSTIYSTEGKLFVLPEAAQRWRPRGRCTVAFMQHPQTGEVRLVVVHGRTGRTCAILHVAACVGPLARGARGCARSWRVAAGTRGNGALGGVYCLRLADAQLTVEFEEAFKDAQQRDATRTLVLTDTRGTESVEEGLHGLESAKPQDLKSGSTTALPPPPEYDALEAGMPSCSTQAAVSPPSYSGPSPNGHGDETRSPDRRFNRLSRTLSRFLGSR